MDGKSTSQEQPLDTASQRWCEILDVTPGATRDQLERAYTRAVSLIEGKSVGGYLMLDPTAAKSARDDVERAYVELKKTCSPPAKKRKGKRKKSKLRAHRHRSHPPRVAPNAADDETPETTVPDAVSPDASVHEVTTPDAESIAPQMSDAEVNHAPPPQSKTIDDDTPSSSIPAPAGEERYASGLPRSAMRILSPVDSKIPTPARDATPSTAASDGETSNQAGSRRLGSHISIAPPIHDDGASTRPDAIETKPPKQKATAPVFKVLPPPSKTAPDTNVGEVKVIGEEAKEIAPPDDDGGLEIRDGDEINGGLIRRLREARKISIDELAKTTKVQRSVLNAIEEQDFELLPARVYLRGFLTQIARVLKVDRKRLADGYIDFVERRGTRS